MKGLISTEHNDHEKDYNEEHMMKFQNAGSKENMEKL
jgi:hypothetical protein